MAPSNSQDGKSKAGNAGDGPQETPSAALIPGFRLLRQIGKGSYGVVWLAQNLGTSNFQALKLIHRDKFADDKPFEREKSGIQRFESISRSHPSQIQILKVGTTEDGGIFYYAMELADDQRTNELFDPELYRPRTLRHELNTRGRLSVDECLDVVHNISQALEHIHRRKMIHRDVKPSNVIFIKGLAKLADPGLVTGADEKCTYVFTEGYVPHEGPGTKQADLFALGKVLYESMTGLNPNPNAEVTPGMKYPSLPGGWLCSPNPSGINLTELNEIVLKACEENPKLRYRDVAEFRGDLELLKTRQSVAARRRSAQRTRLLGYAMLMVVVLCICGAIVENYTSTRARLGEETRRRVLRDLRISRLDTKHAGWFERNWEKLERASLVQKDEEILQEATSTLQGLDARHIVNIPGMPITHAAFSSDGRAVVSGVGQGPAGLIDTNGVIKRLASFGEGPVCWPDKENPQQFLLLGKTLVLRDLITGVVCRQFFHSEVESCDLRGSPLLAVSQDGGQVAAFLNNRVYVWNIAFPNPVAVIPVAPTAMVFSPDGALLGFGLPDGSALVYCLARAAHVANLPSASRGAPLTCLAFGRDPLIGKSPMSSSDKWLLATGDQVAGIVIWDLKRCLPRSYCRGSEWTVTALTFHPSGQFLVSGGRGSPIIWDVATGEPLLRITGLNSGEFKALAFDHAGLRLISGGLSDLHEGSIDLSELTFSRGIQTLRGLLAPARKAWFSSDGCRVAALSDDWHLGVWDLRSGRLLFIFETPVGIYSDNAGGCFNSTGKLFAFATWRDGCIYDLDAGHVVARWNLQGGISEDLFFDNSERLLFLHAEMTPKAESKPFSWHLYRLDKGKSPALLQSGTRTTLSPIKVAFSGDGRNFLSWDWGPEGSNRVISCYDVPSGRELWRKATGTKTWGLPVAQDPSGKWFAYWNEMAGRFIQVGFSNFLETPTLDFACRSIGPSGVDFANPEIVISSWRSNTVVTPLLMDQKMTGLCVYSPDGRYVAFGKLPNSLLIVDVAAVNSRLSALPGKLNLKSLKPRGVVN